MLRPRPGEQGSFRVRESFCEVGEELKVDNS